MIIALVVTGWDMDVWADRIRRELPGAEVRLPDALGDPAEIDYAFVWKPKPGFLATPAQSQGDLLAGGRGGFSAAGSGLA